MSLFGHRLAVAVAVRLSAVLPPDFVLVAAEGNVTAATGNGKSWSTTSVASIVDQPGDRTRLVAGSATNVLSAVQDFIAQTIAEPWPEVGRRHGPWALPHAVVQDGVLRMWYGDEKSAFLQLPDVSLIELDNAS